MNELFLTLLLILIGGLLPLLLIRQFNAMKMLSIIIICGGCIFGLFQAAKGLYSGSSLTFEIDIYRYFSMAFQMDAIAAFFLVPIFVITILGMIFSFHYMNQPEKSLRTAVNYFFFGLLTISMVCVVLANNLFTFALSWEIMSISSFFLVIYDYQKEIVRKAGYYYFVFTQAGALVIFATFGILYTHTGNLEFSSIHILPENIKLLVFIMLFFGFGSKAGIFPVHVWLPHAHPAAPSHVSAIMSGVMIKMGIYGIIRFYNLLGSDSIIFGQIVLGFGVISGIYGVVQALGQHNLKRLLAYHSVENIGIILIGLGIGMIGISLKQPLLAALGFSGALLHVLNHAIFKSLLFMGAGVVIQKTGIETIDQLGGLLKRMKVTGVTFLIGSLAISGLPPFNGFVSEFLIYFASFKGINFNEQSFIPSCLSILSLALIGGLALACFTKVIGIVFLGEPRTKKAEIAKEGDKSMLIPMIVLSSACLFIGVFPSLFIRMSLAATKSIMVVPENMMLNNVIEISHNITFAALILFGLMAVIYLLRMAVYHNKTITRSSTWGCGFTKPTPRMQYTGVSFASLILNFFKPMAPAKVDHPAISGHFPKSTYYHSEIIDIAETNLLQRVVKPVLIIFDKLRWIQHGDIHLYIGYILLAIILLLLFI
jgi:hydrogenase-4 component B